MLTIKPYFINWLENKGEFREYLKSKHYNPIYAQSILSYLNKHVKVIREPMDVIRICSSLSCGQQHNLNRALSALLKFYEIKGYDDAYLNSLRKAIPRDNIGVDLNVPTEREILNSLSMLSKAPLKYQALYNLLLDSGLRLTEAVRALNGFKKAEHVKGFHRITLGFFRASKIAYAAYFTERTLSLIYKVKESVKECGARRYYQKYGYVTPKYIRKFAFDTMISLDIPESVADFIQGRTPKKIGAKHYMALMRQADNFYQRYANHLHNLRSHNQSLTLPPTHAINEQHRTP